jgi:hypothetical protein
VQRILEANQLAPHRIRMFRLSTDPKFAEKLKDVVGLYFWKSVGAETGPVPDTPRHAPSR